MKRDSISGAPKHPVGHGVVGIDIGTRTLAYSADSKVDLIELADRVQNIEQEKCCFKGNWTEADGRRIRKL